ncbi:hypothetical protein [Pandoraea captiosa]|uniref:hypothetical protein n=1 Tax=Pandoraea captiosa TaxID=2508302 RepID=UPI0012415782|nr:hypothetical protein [Pandoraea captiosa]
MPGNLGFPLPFGQSGGAQVLAQSAVPVSVTGVLTETVLATVTVPAGAMGPNGVLRLTTMWSFSSTAVAKTLYARLGGVVFMNPGYNQAGTASMQHMTFLRNRASQTSQTGFSSASSTPFGTSSIAAQTYSIDTSIAQSLTLSGKLSDVADSITLESYTVEILNP